MKKQLMTSNYCYANSNKASQKEPKVAQSRFALADWGC